LNNILSPKLHDTKSNAKISHCQALVVYSCNNNYFGCLNWEEEQGKQFFKTRAKWTGAVP
jgi:hypothetical protein